ncbi:uncharacterized protein LOC134812555 [Bolinopsis microptera]|uniref:uncharacterized protein LOC134812555 n=1 Tax=Bolinopsis microptera TaxID=2820187 RepID=UPI003078D7B3
METDEYSCSGSGDGACKRIAGTKLSKKSYKETCKFTINSLLSKPDRPHKTPAPHVNCKITNKKAHTVFSFNDSPEKLIKIKSPHMLTAEVKKLYSPPNIEGYRFIGSGSREGLNLAKEGKYKPCAGGVYSARPTTTTVSATFRPTTAQLLYQRQLSKQEHRSKDRSDNISETGFDSDNDPFKFTASNCSNGHSPEFDKFAYHSPEHSSCHSDTKLSGEIKFSLSESSSGFSDRSRDKLDSRHVKTEPMKVEKSDLWIPEIRAEISDSPKPTIVFSPPIGTMSDTPGLLAPISSPTTSSSHSNISTNVITDMPLSVPCPSSNILDTDGGIPNSPPKSSEEQVTIATPSSKLYRGKLSFFKQAISQEISTLSEKKALAQLTAEAVENKSTLELTEPVATVVMPQLVTPESPSLVSVTNSASLSPVPVGTNAIRSSVAGIRSPVADIKSPVAGIKSPVAGIKSPVAGIKSPVAGIKSPVAGIKSPVAGIKSPVAGIKSPVHISNIKSPVAGIKSPVAGIKSPVHISNIKSPVAGIKSPVAEIKSPVHMTGPVLKSPKLDNMTNSVTTDKPNKVKDITKSPVPAKERVPLSKDLPTNVVRNVVKRPLPVQAPQKNTNNQKTKSPVTKNSYSPVSAKKPPQKVVHSINSSPIPFVMNGHKVNVVKIEKHHMNPHAQISHKDLSVFKFTNDQPPQHPGYPIPFSDYIKVQSRKRKISGESPKSDKTKKMVKTSILSPPHQITFSPSSPTHPPTEIVKVESSVQNKKTAQSPKLSHPAKSRKISGHSVMSTTKKTLHNKLLSQQGQIKTKVSRSQSCPAVKEEPATEDKETTSPLPEATEETPAVKTEATEETPDVKTEATEDATVCSGCPVKTVGTPTPVMPTLDDPKCCVSVEPCPDGGATVVRLNMDVFNTLTTHQQHLIVDYFFEVTFGETNGVADHVMGIISNGSQDMPNVLKYLVDNQPGLKVKHQVLGKKDVLSCTISEYYDKVKDNHSQCIYHEGGLQHVSLVGTKSEESGALFPELIQLMELNPFFEVTLPWGSLSRYDGLDPTISNDGPIFWVRPGEQFLQSTSGSRNHKGYRLLKNRETLVPDRTTPHADHSWEDGKTIATTAAAAFLQTVQFPGAPRDAQQSHSLKDVIAFDAANFYQLAEELQLDLYEPPMTQCDIWIEDAKLNQLRESNVKYAKIRLRANDMYFIPRNVIHQFKTVAACLSVAWHVRLKKYYDS